MKAHEELKELKLKSIAELHKILNSSREKMHELKFKAFQNQLKNVRELRSLKKKIAKILTLINQKSKTEKATISK
jgi:ribosomal protein L29